MLQVDNPTGLRRVAHAPSARAQAPVNEADPRVKRTRKLLQDTFLELLAEKSFDSITVQDIAQRSTINRATFYAHFVDKHDLFGQVSREWFRKAVQKRLPAAAPLSRANLRLLILATMEALADLDGHCRPIETLKPLIMSAVQEELHDFLAGCLKQLPRNSLRRRANLEATTAAVSWTIFGAALNWSQSSTRPAAEPAAAQIAALLTDGLSTVLEPNVLDQQAG